MSETGRVVLVTGGAVRVGRATVELLSSSGWRVAFTYRTSAAAATELVREAERDGREVMALQADLDDPGKRRAAVAATVARWGRLDALVNNAAVFPRTPLASLDEVAFRHTLITNLEAPVFLSLACAALLKASRGSVVNLADVLALQPPRSYLAYAVSKAALLAATRALAVELAPEVRVNAVAPGLAAFPEGFDEAARKRLLDRTLLGRESGVLEVARTVRFLLDEASTVTGQVLVVDGGLSLGATPLPGSDPDPRRG